MIDVVAWWLGMMVLGFLTLCVIIALITILYRVWLATLDLSCALVRVHRKRLPRHKWACTPWQAWCHAFWHGNPQDIHAQVGKLFRPSQSRADS